MNITLTLTLTDEQTDALSAKVAERNALNPATPYTPESHLEECLTGLINGYTAEAYNAAVKRLGEGAAKLPYEERKALIQHVESSLK